LRVLFPHQNMVGPSQAGNARGARTAAALLEAGCAVDVVAADRTYLGVPVDRPKSAVEGRLRIERVHLPACASKAGSYAAFQAGVLSRRLPRPDVVLATTPPLPSVAVAMGLAARWRVPLVLEVRDLWPAFLVEGGLLQNALVIRGLEVLELTGLSMAAGVVSVTPGFLPYFRALGVREVLVAVSGLDPSFARPRNAQPGPGFRAIYTGSLNEAYGVGVLAGVARAGAVGGWSVVVTGAGRQESAVRAVPGLQFHGSLPRDKLPPLLHQAHAGINIHAPWPLLATTLTGKLFDYMAAGLPVVEAAGGAMGALVDYLGAGLRCEHGPGALAEAIAWMQSHPEAREEMGAAGAAAASGPLSADAQARRMAQAVVGWAKTGEPVTPGRLARGVVEAARKVARHEPATAIAEAFEGQPSRVAEQVTRHWLDGLEQLAPGPAMAIPSIL